MSEHLRYSTLAGKRMKEDNDSVMKEHHLSWNHSSGFDDFSMPASNSNGFKFILTESLLINKDLESFE